MKDVLINKFVVRFNGKRYKAGEVIKNMPDDIAKELEATSSGNVILLDNSSTIKIPKSQGKNNEEDEVIDNKTKNENNLDGIENNVDSDKEDEEDEEITLPDANLDQTVKKGSKGNAKK